MEESQPKKKKNVLNNLIFLGIILLLLIPQTRFYFQWGVNKIIGQFSPSINVTESQGLLVDYQWQLRDLNGQQLAFDELKGEVLFVSFWATWCPPCVAEMPSIAALHNEYKDSVKFVLVSSEAPEKVQRFFDQKNYKLNSFSPLTTPPELLQSNSLPTTFIIARDGNIVVKKTGAANWNADNVKKALNQLL
ncbi:MAG: TlpA disulfide reductase family protein [Flavobacteriaceae bacterium]|nr:TlpA disulfide reductase family protein [Flavobacteriaceae bacterium]